MLKDEVEAVLESAASAGFPNPDGLWRMTLSEMQRALEAHAESRRIQAEQEDRVAWMTGYYAAIAWHAPRRYPRQPRLVRRGWKPMTEEQMRHALMAFAAERSDRYDFGDAED